MDKMRNEKKKTKLEQHMCTNYTHTHTPRIRQHCGEHFKKEVHFRHTKHSGIGVGFSPLWRGACFSRNLEKTPLLQCETGSDSSVV